MNVTGTATLTAPLERVWDALQNPEVLVRTIPGCQQLETTGPDAYRMTVVAGVASIKGTYQGNVRLTDQMKPSSFVLRASGQGAPGTVDADVTVSLSDLGDGRTRLDYDADATVGGPVGGVGQRMLTAVAKKTAGEFFKAVDGVLAGAPVSPPPVAGQPGLPAAAVPSQTGQQEAAEAVVGGPAQPVAGAVFRAPAPRPRAVDGGGVLPLVLAGVGGAVVALAGVVVGAWVSRRH